MKDRLLRRAPLFGLPFFVALVSLASIFLYRYMRDLEIRRYNQQQRLVASTMACHLQDYLSWLMGDMEKTVQEMDRVDRPPSAADLASLYAHLDNVPEDVVYVDADGLVRGVHPAKSGIVGLDFSDRPAFRKAGQEMRPRLSALYRTGRGGWAFHVDVPLHAAGRFSGVVGGLFNLEPIVARFVAPVRSMRMAVAWIVDREGKVIFSPQAGEVGLDLRKMLAEEGRVVELGAVNDLLSGAGGLRASTARDGSREFLAFEPIRLGPTGASGYWGLAVKIPETEVLANLRGLFWALTGLYIVTMVLTLSGAGVAFLQQKGDNRALAETNDKLRQFSHAVSSIREAVIITDLDGRIVFANEAVSRILGWEAAGQGGADLGTLLRGSCRPDVSREIAAAEQGSFTGEVWCRRDSGDEHPVLVSSSVIVNDRGRPYLAVHIFRDIGDLKRAEGEVNRRRLELESHLHTISHDLKTPLITIKGYVDILMTMEKGKSLGEEAMGHLDRIRRAAIRMNALIDSILEVSRAGLIIDQSQKIPFGKCLEIVAGYLEEEMRSMGIDYAAAGDFPEVYADPERLTQLLANLLANAVKFSDADKEQRRVEVAWREEGDGYLFWVMDNGLGIDAKYHQKIFEPFFRLDGRAGGDGVGLTIAKRIVEEHGGRIWVESTPGQETTIYFTLPKRPPPKISSFPEKSIF